ncbi:hypothetical protein Q5P01_016180 [Channa striata]|uniref:Uncharacterized protein n=1 Tax=Channa striata TaxID=64152 RepID=A0AA88MHC0_CHASR|nr:hypothetical protein Q5P01_016180 [Channa striata]
MNPGDGGASRRKRAQNLAELLVAAGENKLSSRRHALSSPIHYTQPSCSASAPPLRGQLLAVTSGRWWGWSGWAAGGLSFRSVSEISEESKSFSSACWYS